MAIADQNCRQFTEALASSAPVPGGGGAAALLGALSSALCEMAGNLTVGKKKYADVEPDVRRLAAECESLRARFLALADEDAAAFAPLAKAYALPKDDAAYASTLRAATLEACRPPLEMLRCACRAVELVEEMREKCSRLLLSDVGCAASIAGAALECAALNVFVNTRTLPDDEQALAYAAETGNLLAEYRGRARALTDTIMDGLQRGNHG